MKVWLHMWFIVRHIYYYYIFYFYICWYDLFRHFMSSFSDVLSTAYATTFLFLLGIAMVSLSFSAAEVNIRQIWIINNVSIRPLHIKYLRTLYIVLKLILVDIQLDEAISIVAVNLAQLIHIYYLSSMSQRLIDHSSGMQEVMCVYSLSARVNLLKSCLYPN